MATACSSLHQIFDTTLPDSPSLIDSFSSWNNQNNPVTPSHPIDHSFTEIFGELNFQEPSPFSLSSSTSPSSSSSSPSSPTSLSDSIQEAKVESFAVKERDDSTPGSSFLGRNGHVGGHRSSDSFSSMSSESLQLCTEGLGFESSDDVEDLKSEISCTSHWDKYSSMERMWDQTQLAAVAEVEDTGGRFSWSDQTKRAKKCAREVPPPISSIGRSGKPRVWFESYKEDGRFVLRQVRMPPQEFLHAHREDGRLRLCLVQPGECSFREEDEEEKMEKDEEEDDQGDDLEQPKEEIHGGEYYS
ncbi:hypothetical protein Drorol1_Dr00019214 [Drosera rotundifolia]